MRAGKGNVRGFGPQVTHWQCKECQKWVASTDEHGRIYQLYGCDHVEADGGDFTWAVANDLVIGSVQGTLWDGGP